MSAVEKLAQKPAAASINNIPNKYILNGDYVRGPLRGCLRMLLKVPPAIVDSKGSLCGTTSNLFPVFFCQ